MTSELYNELRTCTNEEAAQMIGVILNSYSHSPRAIALNLQKEHRTIQQVFTRFCREWIHVCASDDYRYDDRNEASHEFCKAICDAIRDGDHPLPFI